jgi:outer membrane lipopolysaccharide assembly protein LptE/RlpB
MSYLPSTVSRRLVVESSLLRTVLLFLCACMTPGCGYHFAGAGNLPQGIQRLRLAEVENATLEVGAEKELQWALERELRNHSGITIAEDGEGIVNVTLRRLDLRPLSFDHKDQVLEYELFLAFEIIQTHRDTGQVLWQADNIEVVEDFSAIPQVVVTSSPKFWQGTLNPEDLQGLTDVQFSETQRQLATTRLFEVAARATRY